jgi:iron complex transport system substrate-binding protein
MTRLTRLSLASLLAAAAALAMGLWIKQAGAQAPRTDAVPSPSISAPSMRIASVGGDITEILYALGRGGQIVAVDSTSQCPAEALQTKKSIGYVRALSTEGVLSTNPTLILATNGAGPPEVVKALRSSQIEYLTISEDYAPAGIAAKVRQIARATQTEARGEELGSEIESRFATLSASRAKITKPIRALFVLTVQSGRATVGGAGTSADAMLRLAGAVNALGDVHGFKPISDEAFVEAQPDAIVVMNRGGQTHNVEQLLALPGVQSTPAGKAGRVIEMDGLYPLGFGPRAPDAARDLMSRLYPNLDLTVSSK